MKTVGEILKNQRQKVNLTLEEVAKKTRIQEKYLVYIENDDFKHLPTATFVKGFIQNYAKAIGLDSNIALAIFRRDFAQDRQGRIVPRSLITPIEKKLTISPRFTYNLVIGILILLVLSIFARQIIQFYQGPEITLDNPQENQQVTSPIVIEGNAKNAVRVTVNNQDVPLNQADESFSTQIQLSPGDHTITISADSRDDKTKILQRHITVVP